jgi:hypothetical protein
MNITMIRFCSTPDLTAASLSAKSSVEENRRRWRVCRGILEDSHAVAESMCSSVLCHSYLPPLWHIPPGGEL